MLFNWIFFKGIFFCITFGKELYTQGIYTCCIGMQIILQPVCLTDVHCKFILSVCFCLRLFFIYIILNNTCIVFVLYAPLLYVTFFYVSFHFIKRTINLITSSRSQRVFATCICGRSYRNK